MDISHINKGENLPFVSVIIPCRNEENFINKCLDSIIYQEYPKDKIEIVIIDGMSDDCTEEIIKEYIKRYQFIRLLKNEKKFIPSALNIGIRKSKGKIIIRMDAHNVYKRDYISKSIKYLLGYNVDNVGGMWIILPGDKTNIAKTISLTLSHPFGIGNAYYRIGCKKPKFVDTVPFGCYKKNIFDKIGMFDEKLLWSEDDEFNARIIKNGGKILLVPEIISYYYARDTLLKLAKQYFQYGHFKPLVAKKVGGILTWRQIIPSLFIGSLILALLLSFFSKIFFWLFLFILGLYTSINFFISLIISIKKKDLRLLPSLIASFITLHFSYGFGYIKGIWDFIVFKKHLKKKVKDMPLTR